jgi:hypothetical protein
MTFIYFISAEILKLQANGSQRTNERSRFQFLMTDH